LPKCLNPECKKDLPKGKFACDEKCVRRYHELNPSQKLTNGENEENQSTKLTSEENIWFGQERRKRAMETILKLAKESCPINYKKFYALVSFRTGLSLRKITEDYLEILLELGLLKIDYGILNYVGGAEPHD
jgi:hypothetical protein